MSNPCELFSDAEWKKVATNADKAGHIILRTPGGFALFAGKKLIDDFYYVAKEVECTVCKETVYAAYHQWKKDKWCAICKDCF
jgi:hypothetical protein